MGQRSLTPVTFVPDFVPAGLVLGTSPASTGSVMDEKTMGIFLIVFTTAWEVGVAMLWIKSTFASRNFWAIVWALGISPWAFWRSYVTLTPSLKPASASAFSNPFASASKAGWETICVTPILKTFVAFFSWAKEIATVTTSTKIKIGQIFFHIFALLS